MGLIFVSFKKEINNKKISNVYNAEFTNNMIKTIEKNSNEELNISHYQRFCVVCEN